MAKEKTTSSTAEFDAWSELKDEFPDRINDIALYNLLPAFNSQNNRAYIAPNAHNVLVLKKDTKKQILIDSITKGVATHGVNSTKRNNAAVLRDIYQIMFITGDKIFNSDNITRLLTLDGISNIDDINNGKKQLFLLSQQSSTNPNIMLGKESSDPYLQFGTTQDFDNFINTNNATYSLIENQIPNKQIKKIEIKSDKTTLLHKIRAKGINSDGIEVDIDSKIDNSSKNKFPFIFRPIDTENGKLLLDTHWLDYAQTLPLNEALLFNSQTGLTIDGFFNNDPISDMIVDCIILTQAYKTNFKKYRYTQAQWDALPVEQKNNVHPGDIKADSVIGGLSVFGLANKDPLSAVNSVMTTFLSENPTIANDDKLVKKIKRFLTATSEYNQTMYSTGADMQYHRAYLPWYLEVNGVIDVNISKSLPFIIKSEYFNFVGDKIESKDTIIDVSKAKMYQLDRQISEPVLSSLIVPTNRTPLPSSLDLNTNEGMEFVVYVPFTSIENGTNFFEAIEQITTKNITIQNVYPNTDYALTETNEVLSPPPDTTEWKYTRRLIEIDPPTINGSKIIFEIGITKDQLEEKVLRSLGYSGQNKPPNWVFNATKSLNKPVDIYISATDLNNLQPRLSRAGNVLQSTNVNRWEDISYSYTKSITKGELQDRQYTFDKQDIINQFGVYTEDQATWTADISSSEIKSLTELTIKHYYGDKVDLKITFMDDSTYDIPDIPLKSVRDESIGETLINF